MSERAEQANEGGRDGPQRRQKDNANIYVHKPKRGSNKPGKDRRFMARTKNFDDNMHRKMDGEEIPTTLRVSGQLDLPSLAILLDGSFLMICLVLTAMMCVAAETKRRGDASWTHYARPLLVPCDWFIICAAAVDDTAGQWRRLRRMSYSLSDFYPNRSYSLSIKSRHVSICG